MLKYPVLVWSVCLFETGSHYVAQTDFKVVILLPQSLKCRDYRQVWLCLGSVLLLAGITGAY